MLFSSRTTYERQREGNQIEVRGRPNYSRSARYGSYGMEGRSPEPLYQVSCMLAGMKVCRGDAMWVENILGFHHFSEWLERCDVIEFRGYSLNDLDTLIDDICTSLGQTDASVRAKLQFILFTSNCQYYTKEYHFLNDNNKGVMNFGLLSLIRHGDVVNAACCVFAMKFVVAPERVIATTKTYMLGYEVNASTSDWTEDKNLGFIPTQSFINFGWWKALGEFKRRGIVANIREVAKGNV